MYIFYSKVSNCFVNCGRKGVCVLTTTSTTAATTAAAAAAATTTTTTTVPQLLHSQSALTICYNHVMCVTHAQVQSLLLLSKVIVDSSKY